MTDMDKAVVISWIGLILGLLMVLVWGLVAAITYAVQWL